VGGVNRLHDNLAVQEKGQKGGKVKKLKKKKRESRTKKKGCRKIVFDQHTQVGGGVKGWGGKN